MMDDVDEWWWMMLMMDDEWCWMRLTDDDEWWRWMTTHASCMTKIHPDPLLRPVEMYLPCRVCLWNKDAALVPMQLSGDFKQTNEGGSNNANRSFDTERSHYRQICSHTQELSSYWIRSLQDSASTSSTAWTMVTITIALSIPAVACIANMERQWK